MSAGLRRFALSALFAAAVLAGVGAIQSAIARDAVNPAFSDFRVVYCGERAILRHDDPYTVEPLRTCEHDIKFEYGEAPWAVTPYPLPGYAGALFLPIALLPFKIAKLLWMLALVASFGVACASLEAIVKTRSWIVAGILAPTVGFQNFTYGEPVDITIACACLAALALVRDKPRLAAFAAAGAMIEPTIGIPACLGLFALVPATRLVLAGCGAAAAALSFATLGAAKDGEYVTAFLPLHAHSEVYAVDQYSLTHVLYLFGVEPATAIHTGVLAYFVAIIAGILLASRFVTLGLPRALVALLPVATGMLGGSFVHDVEIAAALPASIVLARQSVLARGCVALLAMQWGGAWRSIVAVVTASSLALSAFVAGTRDRVRFAVAAACIAAFVLLVNAALVMPHESVAPAGEPPVEIAATDISSIAWEWAIRLSPDASDVGKKMLLPKLPVWIGLALLPLSLIELELVLRRSRAKASGIPIGEIAVGAGARNTSSAAS